jgi:hypothetical protein
MTKRGGRFTRRPGDAAEVVGFRWCGASACLGAPGCERCDPSCPPDLHAHRPVGDTRAYVPSKLPDGAFDPARRRSA